MNVVSYCPLHVASVVWQPHSGGFSLLVVCTATYTLAPGIALLAAIQDEPNITDAYQNGDDRCSLLRGTDLVPFKRRVDVVLVGHAYAPKGDPVTSLQTRLVVGAVDKTIRVFGDRSFTLDDQLVGPTRFSRVPLCWERAAGGPGTANPVGMSLTGPSDACGAVAVPNLQPPGVYVPSRQGTIEPVGYGPISPTWAQRQAKLYHRLGTWDHHQWADSPLPEDIDAGGFFNSAPADQQIDEIRPDERLVLENLHPEHPRLVTNLAGHVPRAFVETNGGSGQEVRLRCDTLVVDTDRGTASLTWRGQVVLTTPTMPGRVGLRLTSTSDSHRSATAPSVLTTSPESAPRPRAQCLGTKEVDVASLNRPALPFSPAASPWARSTPAPAPSSPEPPPRDLNSAPTMAIDCSSFVSAPVLPFQPTPEETQMTTPLATPPPLATDTVPPVAPAERPWRSPSCLVTDAPVVFTVLPAAPSGSLLVQAPLDESPPPPPSGSRPDTP